MLFSKCFFSNGLHATRVGEASVQLQLLRPELQLLRPFARHARWRPRHVHGSFPPFFFKVLLGGCVRMRYYMCGCVYEETNASVYVCMCMRKNRYVCV